jgi:hypothetical protein
MAKKVYFIKAKFQTYIKLTSDYDDTEKKEVIDAVNYLPQCEFCFGVGDNDLRIKGTSAYCSGTISSTEVGKLHQVNFEGWFCVDPKNRRDKPEEKLESVINGSNKLVFKDINLGSFIFKSADSKGKEVDSLPVDFEILTKKPDGIDFKL